MKILPVEQRTDEWKELRRSKIGASDIATIMCGSKKEIYDLYDEKVNGTERFTTEAMARGTIMEEEAILWLLGSRLKIERPVCMHEDCDWLIASLDAYHEKRKLLVEIKCPSIVPDFAEDYPRYMRAFWQMQAQMYVTGLKEAVLLVYSPLKSVKKTIFRCEYSIKELLCKGREFYQRIIDKNAPEKPTEITVREDDLSIKIAREFREIDEQLKPLEEMKKALRLQLIDLAEDDPFECEGVKVLKVKARESIDYEAACKAHNIDVSSYKKIPTTPFTWKVSSF